MYDKAPAGKGAGARLLKTSSLVVGARISGAFVGVLTQMLLARLLSAPEIGVFFVATSLAAVLAIICTLGYPMLMPKIAAEAQERGVPSLLRAFVSRARTDAALLCGLSVAALAAVAWGAPEDAGVPRAALIFAALTLPAFALLRLNGSLANAQRRFELGFLPDLFLRPLLLLALVLGLWAASPLLSIEAVLAGHVAIAAGLAVWQMRRLAGRRHSEAMAPHEDSAALAADWRRRAAPLVIAALFIGVFADLDIVLASLFLDGEQLGVFGVCLKISLFTGFGIQAVHQLILRDTADALRTDDARSTHAVMARANLLSLIGSVGSAIVVLVAGREILGFFGEEFVAGYGCLVLLMLAQVVRAAAGPATQVLTLSGHEKACLPVFLTSLVALAASNAVFIQFWGLLGAATAVLAVSALWSGWLAMLAHRKLGLNTAVIIAPR
ncbi:MAG: lipopolysaccharide biosynthesis protein [Parvibaculaceae bacterium]